MSDNRTKVEISEENKKFDAIITKLEQEKFNRELLIIELRNKIMSLSDKLVSIADRSINLALNSLDN